MMTGLLVVQYLNNCKQMKKYSLLNKLIHQDNAIRKMRMEAPVVKEKRKNRVQFNKERISFSQNFKKSGLIKSHGPQVYLLKEIQEAEKLS